MQKRKIFTKSELISVIAIFLLLIVIAVPNFVASLRRARDQVRRDDLGALMGSLGGYYEYFGTFPLSSNDGKIIDCIRPNGFEPYIDKYGKWIFDTIGCSWGLDSFVNLETEFKYMKTLPADPEEQKGAEYLYLSDGKRYQIFVAMEGKNEAEVDQEIINMGLMCGNRICNVGRSYNCDLPKTLDQCEEEQSLLQK